MPLKQFLTLSLASLLSIFSTPSFAGDKPKTVVRIAELEIDPSQLENYNAEVKEEMDIAVRIEPGVLAIYAVAEKDNPSRLHFFEIYSDEAAYLKHRESPHFKKYLAATKSMITSRKLIEATPIMLSVKENIKP
jgi:quinol monooxygenase YgiN